MAHFARLLLSLLLVSSGVAHAADARFVLKRDRLGFRQRLAIEADTHQLDRSTYRLWDNSRIIELRRKTSPSVLGLDDRATRSPVIADLFRPELSHFRRSAKITRRDGTRVTVGEDASPGPYGTPKVAAVSYQRDGKQQLETFTGKRRLQRAVDRANQLLQE